MWRTIDAHLRLKTITICLIPSVSSPSSSVRTIVTQASSIALSSKPRALSLSKTLTSHTADTVACSSYVRLKSSNFGLLVVRCSSSVSPAQSQTYEWTNDPVSSSEVGYSRNVSSVDEDTKRSIPVRAYFFSTRFGYFSVY